LLAQAVIAAPLPADAVVFEAEEMRSEPPGTWQARPHFPGWYTGKPSRLQFLSGHHAGLGQAVQTVRLREPGT